MGQGIDALSLIASAAVLAVAAGMLLGRLGHISESSRERMAVRHQREANRRRHRV
jgi:hypothetical protein